MNAEIGKFKIVDDALYGPESYMNEKGNAKVDAILAGNDAGFNAMIQARPDIAIEQMICTALQTDFAGWLGMKQFTSELGI